MSTALVALRALASLAKDPDDLPKVFTVIESLPGRSPMLMERRMKACAGGQKLLRERPDLARLLADRDALRKLPAGTLGRAYAEMADRVGITPQGIVDASVAGGLDADVEVSDENRFIGDRMRDAHDLWHVVTGFGVDVVGEIGLLAFSYAQTRHPGIALICGLSLLRGLPGAFGTMWRSYVAGRRAEWLPAVAWEDLLDKPLDEVRALLKIDGPAIYEPLTTDDLRARGLLGRAA